MIPTKKRVQLAIFAYFTAAVCLQARAEAPQLEQMTATGLNNLQASVTIDKSDQSELEKINKDFGLAYRFKSVTMSYLEPDKLRLENRIGVLIYNGDTFAYRVPQLNISKKEDLSQSPGKRRSLLDIGLLTASSISTLKNRYLKDEVFDNVSTRVFELKYNTKDTSRIVIWVDPKRKVVLKREWLDGDGKCKATFLYKNIEEVVPGIWIPTRLEVRNCEGIVAGVTTYSDLKINQGVNKALFDIS